MNASVAELKFYNCMNMSRYLKKHFYLDKRSFCKALEGILLACLCFALLISLSSCNRESGKVVFQQYDFVDSANVNGVQAFVNFSVEYPDILDKEGNILKLNGEEEGKKSSKLAQYIYVDSIRNWISRMLARPAVSDTTSMLLLFKGETDSADELLSFYGKWQINDWTTSEDYISVAKDFPDHPVICERRNIIANLYNSTSLISMVDTSYVYEGGAHGSSEVSVATFSTKNGHKYGWDIFKKEKLKALTVLVKEGLDHQYFIKGQGLDAQLLDDAQRDSFPLPLTPPVVVSITNKDGVTETGFCFIYQQYEIVSYSEGIPYCIISYDKVKEMLNPEFEKQLLQGIKK